MQATEIQRKTGDVQGTINAERQPSQISAKVALEHTQSACTLHSQVFFTDVFQCVPSEF